MSRTDESPVASGRPGRRIPRTVLAGAVIVAVFSLIAWNQWRKPRRQAELIEQIKAAGGFALTEAPKSTTERLEGLRNVTLEGIRNGTQWEDGYTEVGLYARDITGDWLRAHDNLTALKITRLKLAETAITGDELADLIDLHPIHTLEFRAQGLNDATIDALARCQTLNTVELRDCALTDAQLPRLPLEQLEELHIHGSQVTSAGLQPLKRAQALAYLTLDGRQFDQNVAKLIAALPALQYVELVGRDVTDEHLLQLQSIPKLLGITLVRTSVTEEGVKALETALPECLVEVR